MKSIKTLFVAASLLLSMATMAQDLSSPIYAKWGETVEERQENIQHANFLKESLDNRNYNQAIFHFKQLLNNAPKASEKAFANALTAFKSKINQAELAMAKNMSEAPKYMEIRSVLVDSLMWVYDVRLEHFGSHAKRGVNYIKERKAREYLVYRADDREGVRDLFIDAINVAGSDVEPDLVVTYYNTLCNDFNNTDMIVPATIIEEYERLYAILETAGAVEEMKQIDNIFSASGAADCAILEDIFKAKITAEPENVEVLKKAVALMGRAGCKSEYYLTIAEKYYILEPSAEAAMFLAQAFQEMGAYDKAAKYINDALVVETDAKIRHSLMIRLALIDLTANRMSSALKIAREASALNPEDGIPYYIIAQCYASSVNACTGFNQKAIFWAAYDTMARSVSLLGEDSDMLPSAKSSLHAFRSYFPTVEEGFFNEVKEGARYTINCGLASGVATTARFNK